MIQKKTFLNEFTIFLYMNQVKKFAMHFYYATLYILYLYKYYANNSWKYIYVSLKIIISFIQI